MCTSPAATSGTPVMLPRARRASISGPSLARSKMFDRDPAALGKPGRSHIACANSRSNDGVARGNQQRQTVGQILQMRMPGRLAFEIGRVRAIATLSARVRASVINSDRLP